MKRELLLVFVVAVLLYLPTVRYGFVQDDRGVIASNPAAHSIVAALAAFKDPYWPRETGAGLYRPVTILSYAVDWTISGGRPAWFHFMNALWHGLATVLFVAIIAQWLPRVAAVGSGLVFAWHPVHVEAVASAVGRAELLVAVGILGAVLAARRGKWVVALLCAAVAMFSKEHGVVVGVVILLDYWLQSPEQRRPYPRSLWIGLVVVTLSFLVTWFLIGWAGENDEAAAFYGTGTMARLAIALPAALRAAVLLFWPATLSTDYGPQVLADRSGWSLVALLGLGVVIAVPLVILRYRRRAPAISFAAGIAALSCLPTANILFASGVVLAERNLYLAVALPATVVGAAAAWLAIQRGPRLAFAAWGLLVAACGGRSIVRLPAWRDNRTQLLTLLREHPESYRAHGSAAAVLAGIGDTAGARREYAIADSLFSGDPYLEGARAIFLVGIGDTAAAVPLVERGKRAPTGERMSLRAAFVLELARGHGAQAAEIAAAATRRFPGEKNWYLMFRQ